MEKLDSTLQCNILHICTQLIEACFLVISDLYVVVIWLSFILLSLRKSISSLVLIRSCWHFARAVHLLYTLSLLCILLPCGKSLWKIHEHETNKAFALVKFWNFEKNGNLITIFS